MNKYIEFLNKLTDKDNAALIESVKNGFKVIFEGRFGNVRHPHDEDPPEGDDGEHIENHIKDVNGVVLEKGDQIIYRNGEVDQLATIIDCWTSYSMTQEGWMHPEDGWNPPEFEEVDTEYLKVEKDGVQFELDTKEVEIFSAKDI